MATIYEVDTNKLIDELAQQLEKVKEIEAPEWAAFVKTGTSKERAPTQENWWQLRAAAILRKVSLKGPIGVAKLRTQYGDVKNRGVQPEKFFRASGNHIRKILQQLDKAGFTVYAEKGVHKGRVLTGKGQSILDKAASAVYVPVSQKVTNE